MMFLQVAGLVVELCSREPICLGFHSDDLYVQHWLHWHVKIALNSRIIGRGIVTNIQIPRKKSWQEAESIHGPFKLNFTKETLCHLS